MFNAEQIEHGDVEVVHVVYVFDGVVAEFISVAIATTALDAAAGHPHGETFDVVIAPRALRHRRKAELAAPDDESVFGHAALLEIADESSGCLVDETPKRTTLAENGIIVWVRHRHRRPPIRRTDERPFKCHRSKR